MTIKIKHKIADVVLRVVEAESLSDADLRYADLSAADLNDANLSGAKLSHANLSRANLSRANLSGANLSAADLSAANLIDADLSDADLSRADLSDADLIGANLSGANLRYANLSDADLPFIPVVERLDSKILAAIEVGGKLRMCDWHTCETTHCRYGWAITLAGKEGKALEDRLGPQTAGALIYWKSAGYIPAYVGEDFMVLEDIRAHARREEGLD